MKKLCLVIMDGYGIVEKEKPMQNGVFSGSLLCNDDTVEKKCAIFENKGDKGDAVVLSTMAEFKHLFLSNPYTLLHASGEAVGLPCGQMGNSEVGHLNIGAGKVVLQDLLKISKAIDDGEFENNTEFASFLNSKNNLHLIGLVSNGNVHSSIEHLFGIMKLIKKAGKKAYIHIITDGRDTDIHSGAEFTKQVMQVADDCSCVIASVSGRYYAMDREGNIDRTQLYFDCITGKNEKEQNECAVSYIQKCYEQDVTDEFIKPKLLCSEGIVQEQDAILFFNFRADRMRQITQMFFDNTKCDIYTMTEYKKDFAKAKVLFKPTYQTNTISEILSKCNAKQLKVAEFSKYAHVTYFLNGGVEKPFDGEDRIMLPMVDVATFDLKPEMSAQGVTEQVICGMQKGYDFICVNYANCDMVGHTGNLQAAKKAVQVVTQSVLDLYKQAQSNNYILVVTADHGNAEVMLNGNDVCTTHTTNRVPFLILNYNEKIKLKNNGALSNIVPTLLDLMEISNKK